MIALYLNNSGSKWIIPGSMRFFSLESSGKDAGKLTMVKRTADYFESFGNFASVSYRVRGKRKNDFFNDFYRFYDEKSRQWLPIINNSGLAWYEGGEDYAKLLGAKICDAKGIV